MSDVRYAVFDDFPWAVMENYHKQWFGAQKTFTVTDKYCSKKTIQWGKPIIWLCNPEDEHSGLASEWLKDNSVRIYIDKKLY